MQDNKAVSVSVDVDMSDINKASEKINLLCEKLREAKTLADEIASLDIAIKLIT